MTLTPTQDNVLAFIRTFIATCGYPPTRREIADRFRWRSTNAAQEILLHLVNKGAITVEPRIARGIRLTPEGA